MRALEETICALRDEVEAALNNKRTVPNCVQLQPDRAVVTLHFRIEDGDQSKEEGKMLFIVESAGGQKAAEQLHSVSIEFKYGATSENARTVSPVKDFVSNGSTLQAVPSVKASSELTKELTQVFGAPGFDSSARADVFREALELLTEAQFKEVGEILLDAPSNVREQTTKRAVSLIERVCRSGPAGPNNGKAMLGAIFRQTSLKDLIRHVATVWKTQQDWME